MSNIYVQEPPTSGKVVLETTLGELEIELWSKECPKACRNFIQLCLEEYYNNTIFHNVVPNFIAQGGDPTGTGLGGESIYGEPFKNELHSRLRFVRRGLVATANSGNNDNVSQFFFTLGPTPELKNKHTIFGRVTGNTVFNMMKFNDVDTDKEGRPIYPPKIIKTEVILNPFPDIEPRNSATTTSQLQESKGFKSKGTRNLKLLSFGEEDTLDEDEDTSSIIVAMKAKTSHDLIPGSEPSTSLLNENKKLPTETSNLVSIPEATSKNASESTTRVDSTNEISKRPPKSRVKDQEKVEIGETSEDKLKSIREEIKQVKRSLKQQEDEKTSNATVDSLKKTAEVNNDVLRHFHEEQQKYAEKKRTNIVKGDKREVDTLQRLETFRRKLHEASSTTDTSLAEEAVNEAESESWLGHKLRFEKETPTLAKDANTKDDKWFDIYDPRNALNKRRRQTLKAEKTKHPKLN